MFSKIILKSRDKNSHWKKMFFLIQPQSLSRKKDQTSQRTSRLLLHISVDVLLLCLAPFTFITPLVSVQGNEHENNVSE